jgi:hypothetical protein
MYINRSWTLGESFILCCACERTERQIEHGRKLTGRCRDAAAAAAAAGS